MIKVSFFENIGVNLIPKEFSFYLRKKKGEKGFKNIHFSMI